MVAAYTPIEIARYHALQDKAMLPMRDGICEG
jgi:hypothetical protein